MITHLQRAAQEVACWFPPSLAHLPLQWWKSIDFCWEEKMEDYHECVVSVICRWDDSTIATVGWRADHCKTSVPGVDGLMATSFICVEVGHWLRVRSWEEAHERRNKRSESHLLLHSEKFTAISKWSFLISTFSSETWPYRESKTHSRARGSCGGLGWCHFHSGTPAVGTGS